MRATGGHRFSICRKGEKWLATYDQTEAEGQTRTEAVQKLNQHVCGKRQKPTW